MLDYGFDPRAGMRANGVHRVMVETWDDNAATIHSYETAGFRRTSLGPTYRRDFS